MGLTLTRFDRYELNLVVYADVVARADLLGFYGRLDARDPANARAWLTYVSQTSDFRSLHLQDFVDLKEIVSPKVKHLARTSPAYGSFIVCSSFVSELVANFWRDYVGTDPDYPYPVFFSDLGGCCDWLELSEAACAAVQRAIVG